MNTKEYNTAELSFSEKENTNGGLLFLIFAAPALAAAAANAALIAAPLVYSFKNGWDSYEEQN